ncbi:hypothetical protein NEF87_000469 [Candidatus Lokiarchaeum ossiferum]|uniref:TNase-like domain-containing protein n=1 Tax=Candidatus Lokiarchaeum ossiferum TaxID=2951803 RepID=A0ABY6HKZ0_9ARCH|nr:hypothetical protein NEF87_000469 [Candidatus Lokiarchaeum sp. B-35]
MSRYKVVKVIDGDTFVVSPGWSWKGKKGNRVRPEGYDARELNQYGGKTDMKKLEKLILGKTIEITKNIKFSYNRLLYVVKYRGKDLKNSMK